MNPSMPLARKSVLAAVEEKPEALRRPGTVSDGPAARRAVEADDNVLRERAVKWLAALPADLRPMATAGHYPRIVNRMDELWSQCEYTRLHFQSLLVDRREGRKGFPLEVRRELEALQNYYFEHLSGLPAILWNAVPVYPPRIPNRTFAPRVDTSEIDILPL